PLSEAERKPLVDAFVRLQQQTQTYQADLRQTVRLRGLNKPVESIGKIFYKAPGSLRISFAQPAGEYMLINGEKVYSKKTNRPLRKSKDRNAGMLLTLFQGGVKNWEEEFDITYAREDDRLFVTLQPRRTEMKVEIENVVVLPSYNI